MAESNSTYKPTYSAATQQTAPADLQAFITNFYRISDIKTENENWLASFTDDAELTMGNDKGKGKDEIWALRLKMWKGVASRKHTVIKVFPGVFTDDADAKNSAPKYEMMLTGSVHRTSDNGGEAVIPWASQMILRKESGQQGDEWKLAYYRVWLQF